MREMRDAAIKNGMRFYVSDAHFKELCCNGCCCGLSPEWNYSRGQFTQALMIAKEKNFVSWSDISKENTYLKKPLFKSACGFNSTSVKRRAKYYNFTLHDYLHSVWNDLKHGQNPYKYFGGVLEPYKIDENGDIVYRYKGGK